MIIKDLKKAIMYLAKESRLIKLRVFEEERSYEDFSISHKLNGDLSFNFEILEEEGVYVLRKKARKSTRHVVFNSDLKLELEVRGNKKKYMALIVHGDVYYTDGNHRYQSKSDFTPHSEHSGNPPL